MDNLIIHQAESLALELSKRRLTNIENELVRVVRLLPSVEKLRIVRLVMEHNVRAAAAVAARINIAAPQLTELLIFLITLGKSNAIRVMVEKVLVHRMKAGNFHKVLTEKQNDFSAEVYFAVYYYLASTPHCPARCAEPLKALLAETRPS